MRTISYKLAGKEVRSDLVGQVVTIRQAETMADAVALCGGNESLVLAKFNDGYAIAAQGNLRRAAGKKEATRDTLQTVSDKYVLAERGEGNGSTAEVKPETQAKRAAAASGNRLFEKAAESEKKYALYLREGLIEEAEFKAWKAARDAKANGKTAPQATATV